MLNCYTSVTNLLPSQLQVILSLYSQYQNIIKSYPSSYQDQQHIWPSFLFLAMFLGQEGWWRQGWNTRDQKAENYLIMLMVRHNNLLFPFQMFPIVTWLTHDLHIHLLINFASLPQISRKDQRHQKRIVLCSATKPSTWHFVEHYGNSFC
jgi:hypothetical protein